MSETTTIGREMIRDRIPGDMPMPPKALNKKALKEWFGHMAREMPERYPEILLSLTDVAREAMDSEADRMSLSLKDFQLPPRSSEYRERLIERIRKEAVRTDLDEAEKDRRVSKLLTEGGERLKEKVLDEAGERGNAFIRAIDWGIKGSPQQLLQLLAGDVAAIDTATGKFFPFMITRSYSEGLSPMEAWAANYGARTALAATKMATPETGYFGKQLTMLNHRLVVAGNDCGVRGKAVYKSLADPETLGSFLAEDLPGFPRDTVVDENVKEALGDEDVPVRSVLTCEHPDGVCRKCAGLREDGHMAPLGSYLGITTAHALTEPLIQSAIGTKHGGAGAEADDDPRGFYLVDNMFQLREGGFRGAGAVSPADSTVKGIETDSKGHPVVLLQSGHAIQVPRGREVIVRKGEDVRIGQPVSDGIPDPREVADLAGIGEARRIFMDSFRRVLEDTGASIRARNIEPTVRSFLNHIEVTEPNVLPGYIPGDTVLYDIAQRMYSPREDSRDVEPSAAPGTYLEEPVLHYTIGTPISMSIAEDMKKRGVSSVRVHDKPPGFRPAPVKLRTAMDADPDWKAQQAGWYLNRNFLENVRRGAESDFRDSSFVSFLMNPFDPRLHEHPSFGTE